MDLWLIASNSTCTCATKESLAPKSSNTKKMKEPAWNILCLPRWLSGHTILSEVALAESYNNSLLSQSHGKVTG